MLSCVDFYSAKNMSWRRTWRPPATTSSTTTAAAATAAMATSVLNGVSNVGKLQPMTTPSKSSSVASDVKTTTHQLVAGIPRVSITFILITHLIYFLFITYLLNSRDRLQLYYNLSFSVDWDDYTKIQHCIGRTEPIWQRTSGLASVNRGVEGRKPWDISCHRRDDEPTVTNQ